MLRSFVVALLSLISGSALAVDTTFLLVNSTSYPINQMSISQHDMQMWSPNLFRGPVIKPGFADGTPPATWQYLNLCSLRKIQVFYDRYSGITTARYDE